MNTLELFIAFKHSAQKHLTKKRCRTMLIVSMLLLTSSCVSWLQPTLKKEITEIKAGEYKLDKDHAALLFKINHMGFSSYVGRFNEFNVSLDFNPNDIENSRIEAIIDMRSIDVNNPDFAATLKGTSWLNTLKFPQAVFRSVSIRKIEGEQVRIDGELTFLGVTRTVFMTAKLNGAANNPLTRIYTLGFTANLRFKRSDFGLKRFIPIVGDEVEIEIQSEFLRQ
ncbi:MAG: polyisoprenoid-binding protein YceI [Gammaproteobacteria bacterium]|jgi:polyisoprenoid-binding protein YceI